jgi:hypothetical protein
MTLAGLEDRKDVPISRSVGYGVSRERAASMRTIALANDS